MVAVPFHDLKELVQQCSKEAVKEALKKDSPSFFSSTLHFIADPRKIVPMLFYGSIITAIIGITASKHYWMTPKKFDELLQQKEDEVIREILELGDLVEQSKKGVTQAYTKNLLGIQAGLAALGETIKQSEKKLNQRYNTAYEDELNRRMRLLDQSRILSNRVQVGMQKLISSLDTAQNDIQYTQRELVAQKLTLENLEERREKEFDVLKGTLTGNYLEEVDSLNSLINTTISGDEDMQQTLLQTEVAMKVLEKTLLNVNENEGENHALIQQAFGLVEHQKSIMNQIEELLQEPGSPESPNIPLPGSSLRIFEKP